MTKAFIGNDLKAFIVENDEDSTDDEDAGWDIEEPQKQKASRATDSIDKGKSPKVVSDSPTKFKLSPVIRSAPETPIRVKRQRDSFGLKAGLLEDLPKDFTPLSDIIKRRTDEKIPNQQDSEQFAMISHLINQAVTNAMGNVAQTIISRVKSDQPQSQGLSQDSLSLLEAKIEKQIKKELAIQENKLSFVLRSSVTNFKRERDEMPILEVAIPKNKLTESLKVFRSALPSNSILLFFIFYILWSISSSLSAMWAKLDRSPGYNTCTPV